MGCQRVFLIAFLGLGSHVQTTSTKVVETQLAAPQLGFDVHVFAPSAGGDWPVVFFLGGFAGNVPVWMYSDLLTRIAARDFVVVGLNRFGTPEYRSEGHGLLGVLAWALAGELRARMANKGFAAVPDVVHRAAVMGQSAGNHVIGQALEYDCSIAKAWVMLDPVDGFDPYRLVKSEDLITPGKMLNFTIPALILDNGLDPQGSTPFTPACDPKELGTARFLPAMRGPVWNINATRYGHADCFNDAYALPAGLLCKTLLSTNKSAYRELIADSAAIFLGALFQNRPDDFELLEDPGRMPVEVKTRWDLKGLTHKQVGPGCSNTVPKVSRVLV